MYERALAEARRILETHVPEPLPEEVADRLAAIIRDAERELGVDR
jgi:trimethylamine:corrinoid methyltransferase-like protein